MPINRTLSGLQDPVDKVEIQKKRSCGVRFPGEISKN